MILMVEKVKNRGWKFWLNIITLTAVVLLVFFSRHELVEAWNVLLTIHNWWLLLLLLPLQILVYYSMSEIGMSYLEKRKQIKKYHWWTKTILSLELNFVNHVLPSGGASGFSYSIWRLKGLGVDSVHATMAMLIRTVVSFVAFVPLLILAVLWIAVSNQDSNFLMFVATGAAFGLIFTVLFGMFLIGDRARLLTYVDWLTGAINTVVKKITFGRKKHTVNKEKMKEKTVEFHKDYEMLMREKSALKKPILWGIVWILADVAMFEVTFIALGHLIDPMILLLAYGASCVASFLMLTPGGTGAYESAFIVVLASAGVAGGLAVSGTLLTRIILVLGTLVSGYYFYHKAINTGKSKNHPNLTRPKLKK